MKNNAKRISSICCLVLSIGFLGGFGYSFATFLITTAATAPSFAEAAKNLLLFLASAFGTFGTLCIGAVFAYVSALLGVGKLKKSLQSPVYPAIDLAVLLPGGAGVHEHRPAGRHGLIPKKKENHL